MSVCVFSHLVSVFSHLVSEEHGKEGSNKIGYGAKNEYFIILYKIIRRRRVCIEQKRKVDHN